MRLSCTWSWAWAAACFSQAPTYISPRPLFTHSSLTQHPHKIATAATAAGSHLTPHPLFTLSVSASPCRSPARLFPFAALRRRGSQPTPRARLTHPDRLSLLPVLPVPLSPVPPSSPFKSFHHLFFYHPSLCESFVLSEDDHDVFTQPSYEGPPTCPAHTIGVPL